MTSQRPAPIGLGMPTVGPRLSQEARQVEALRAALVAVEATELTAEEIREDLAAGEEWLALEEVLYSVADGSVLTPELLATAAAVALEVAGGEWEMAVPDDGSPVTAPTPQEFVTRMLAIED